MNMTITATGDAILMRNFEEGGYPGMEDVARVIREGQARLGNLETTLTNYDTYASSTCGGFWQTTEPEVLQELPRLGINMLGFANNHTMDYGPDGCLETLAHVRRAGIPVCGAGKDLGEAAAPAYLDCAGGRMALLACTASFYEYARAGYGNQYFKGRPGLNPLRYKAEYYVNEAHFQALKEISDATAINGQQDASIRNGFAPKRPADVMSFLPPRGDTPVTFRLSPDGREYKRTFCHPDDLERMVKSIEEARLFADYVAIEVHTHQIKGFDMTEPDYFFEEFAHAAIDAGADLILGGGVHHLRPIELYKGKPIFYSLGNFIFQVDMEVRQPYETEEVYGKGAHFSCSLTEQEFNYRSFIPRVEFENGKCTDIRLTPIELGFDAPRSHKGLPVLAGKASAKKTFEDLVRASAPYGTRLSQDEDGTIRVELS